jgi:hypothetical protein
MVCEGRKLSRAKREYESNRSKAGAPDAGRFCALGWDADHALNTGVPDIRAPGLRAFAQSGMAVRTILAC